MSFGRRSRDIHGGLQWFLTTQIQQFRSSTKEEQDTTMCNSLARILCGDGSLNDLFWNLKVRRFSLSSPKNWTGLLYDKSCLNLASFIDNCGINLNTLLLRAVIKHLFFSWLPKTAKVNNLRANFAIKITSYSAMFANILFKTRQFSRQ